VVIHPGFDAAWYKGDKRKLLTGPSYLPLRKSIVKNYRHIPKKIDNIVVFGGGTDFYGFGLQIARIIKDFEDFNSAIFFSDQRKEIETLDGRFSVLDFGFNFDEHIAKSDLVLTTASTSCLEILARELPLGIAQAIDNQKNTFQIFGNKGFAAQIGERLPSGEWRMNLSNISNLITDSEFRNKLVAKSKDVVDLNGAKRIIDKVIE
jgi:spore coat polysaccharide biosynthesis predicted glycosyltransferase SpsG